MNLMISVLGQYRNRLLVFLHDLAWVPIALYLSFGLRFNLGHIPAESLGALYWMAGVALPIFAGLYWFFGLYRGTWRFVSISDLIRLVKTVVMGVLATTLAVVILYRFEGIPRSVLILFPLLLAQGLAAPRLLYRWLSDKRITLAGQERQRALIVGAGQPGELLLRNLVRNGLYLPVGFVDPDPRMAGKEIHGVRVLGELDDIPVLVRRNPVDIVLLAIPDVDADVLRKVLELCTELGLPCRTLPRRDLSGQIVVDESKLRPVRIEDLLSREPVTLNLPEITRHLRGRRVLVTGGGGSIGAELCHQVASRQPELLVVFDHSEYNLYAIEGELRRTFPDLNFRCLLGDMKNPAGLERLFSQHRPHHVFHAAAYKHVPLLETNAAEAVLNNVFGTLQVAQAADRYGCEQFVLISTDKAVNPTNVMGATKRLAEIFCQNFNSRSATRFITTRFGNVLGSVGSVVPLFEAQIANGGPVTVTHPDIERYFMTIPEAVGLILQASSIGKGGEIFVLEMGRPVKIKDLAEQMIRLAGLKPYQDVPILFTGLRPGEKLFEELFHESEGLIGTSNPKLLLAAVRKADWDRLSEDLQRLEESTRALDEGEVLRGIKRIVPEFDPGTDLEDGGGEAPARSGFIRLVKP